MSLGGSLAFGGAGAQSHRHGLQIDHVAELEVALVTGELVRCSRRERADLFDAVLGGLGQFGFVTKVTLQPVKAPREVAVANLYYDDFRSMTEDLEDLARQNRFDSLDNYILPGDPPLRPTEIGLFVYDDQPVPDLAPLSPGARQRREFPDDELRGVRPPQQGPRRGAHGRGHGADAQAVGDDLPPPHGPSSSRNAT